MDEKESQLFYDIVTTYNILLRRPQCQEQTDYAKNYTLNLFNQIIEQFSSYNNTLILNGYLYYQALIIGLVINDDIKNLLIFNESYDENVFEPFDANKYGITDPEEIIDNLQYDDYNIYVNKTELRRIQLINQIQEFISNL